VAVKSQHESVAAAGLGVSAAVGMDTRVSGQSSAPAVGTELKGTRLILKAGSTKSPLKSACSFD